MAGIFKAYDIRGIYGDTLTTDIAFKIGRAFATFVKCKKVVVGRDIRSHSADLFEALSQGLMMQGADVVNLNECSTPMSYYANGLLKADASIIITASHNPAQWNGFKLCREQAIPISGATGIKDIERIVMEDSFDAPAEVPGTVTDYDIAPEYVEHVGRSSAPNRRMKIVADFANGMGICEAQALYPHLDIDPLFDTLDGTFPNHEANPLKLETLRELQDKVRGGSYDFGVAFDGDADRAGFVDEKGDIIPMDMTTALIAGNILATETSVILYDLRSSWAVKEVIEEQGGTPTMCRVGHAFIKQQMRDADAVFAGELSGHYYFRDNYFTESSAMATLAVATVLSNTDKPLSELIRPIQRYYASGEINSEVEGTDSVLESLRKRYADGNMFELDGVSVEFEDWWFNVRKSNTEPLIRLNLEAKTPELMKDKREEVLAIIRNKR